MSEENKEATSERKTQTTNNSRRVYLKNKIFDDKPVKKSDQVLNDNSINEYNFKLNKTGISNNLKSKNATKKVNESTTSNEAVKNSIVKTLPGILNTNKKRLSSNKTNTKVTDSSINKSPKTSTTHSKQISKTNTKKTTSNRNTKPSLTKTSSSKGNNKTNSISKTPSIKIAFLGGLDQIGKNMSVIECENDMFILDCGMAFPDGDMLGVDLVIPDFSYIEKNKGKIKGIVLTHGHEDHIGALPYFLKNMRFPIYGTGLTIGLVTSKLKEHNLLSKTRLNVINPGQSIKLGCMEVEFIRVNHSIPDAVAVAIHSPAGTVVHTGDFKIDCTPTNGQMIDLARFAELGKEGVLALLADSTNAERPGYTMTEQKISDSFEHLFQKAENHRIIIATFASNIGRIQQIIDCADRYGRKVAFSGRSMLNYMNIAGELGYVNVPDGIIVDIDLINRYPKDKVVLVTTGSQGEPMSALSRMAYSDHRKIEVGTEDFIIISANPIPGNEKMVNSVINELLKLGCTVVYESMYEVHVSGHACQEELKIMQAIAKPQYFIPVHGELKHLKKHADLAKSMGMDGSNILIPTNGSYIELNKSYIRNGSPVQAGKVLVDGLGVGDVGSIVLRDRKHLGQDGLIVVVSTLDSSDGHVISGPDIVSRGFVYVKESETLMDAARRIVVDVLESCADEKIYDWGTIKIRVREELSKFFYDKTGRSPMILPIIMEI